MSGIFSEIDANRGQLEEWARIEGLDATVVSAMRASLTGSEKTLNGKKLFRLAVVLYLLFGLSGCAPKDGSICPGSKLPDSEGRIGCMQVLPEFLQKLLVGDPNWSSSPGAIDLRGNMSPDENGECPPGMKKRGVFEQCIPTRN